MDTSDLVQLLRGLASAYPEEIFASFTHEEAIELGNTHPGVVDRISAQMGRRLGQFLTDASDAIERLEERCAAYKGQVEYGAAEIERVLAAIQRDGERIGGLKAVAKAAEAERDALRLDVERLRAEAEEAERAVALAGKTLFALGRTNARLTAGLIDVIDCDHHNHYDGPQPRYVEVARAALKQEPKTRKGGTDE